METHYLTTEMIADYQEYLFQNERSERTIDKYIHDVTVFYHQLGNDKGIVKETLIKWKDILQIKNYAVATINSMLAAVNGLCRFLGWEECCVNPLKQHRRIFRDRARELSRGEYVRLLKTAKQKKQHRLMLVMETICSTGIRVSELQYITRQAVDNECAVVRCKGKSRTILISGELCVKLRAYCQKHGIEAGPIFLSKYGKPLNRSNIWADMKKLCKDARVEPQKVFPHNLRHLFARLFYQMEKDIAKLADVLGHANIETTRIYIMESGVEHVRMISRLHLVL